MSRDGDGWPQRPADANRLPADVRYLRDPVFHHLVDTMLAAIQAGQFTPTEIREAAILAATIFEMERKPGDITGGWDFARGRDRSVRSDGSG